MLNQLAPGARVEIRNEEWLVRRIDPSSDDGMLLLCDGVSELVRGRSALFLSKLEANIAVLDPAKTELVLDTSSHFDSTFLYLESQLRRSVPNDQAIHLGHRAVMNLVPYQLDPALQGLTQPRTRILIADAVGLGKTLEAGILATELIQRGRGKRILVVTQKSMLTQFQKEWWARFSIPLVRLDSLGLQRVRTQIPTNHNPFNYFDRSIISMDTLKNNLEYRNYLSRAWWDIIVIDECHNVAARAGEQGLSRRARLAQLLATRSDTLILLSATPHDGSARSFASLVALLDPTAISNPDDYTNADYSNKGLVIRRFKKDIKDQVSADFQERIVTALRQTASPNEEAAFEALLAVPFTQAGQRRAGRQQELQRIAMQKAIFSSPVAALVSTRNRIRLLEAKPGITADETKEVAALRELEAALEAIGDAHFAKYHTLRRFLGSPEFGWDRRVATDRLVIFSERLETLRWLETRLTQDLRLAKEEIKILDGQMLDTEQQAVVESFGQQSSPLRVLLCSDVASEGLNLHYFCHRLIHFDLPWSLMVFQQRNGRVDRYGQKNRPQIVYLFTETSVEKIKGDLRILEILQQKDEQAQKNLGDPGIFLNCYDPDREAETVSGYMAEGLTAEQVSADMDERAAAEPEGDGDWLLDLFQSAPQEAPPSSVSRIEEPFSFFPSDYGFARTALTNLSKPNPIAQWTSDDEEETISITPPDDLRHRLRQLPREVQADQYTLTANKLRMERAIEAARQTRTVQSEDPEKQLRGEANTWPQLHYLWSQHPILEWLGDRVLTAFGRHRAPVIQSMHLAEDEQAYILLAVIPNRKAQPMLAEWRVASRRGRGPFQLEEFPAFAARAGLRARALPNPAKVNLPTLQADVPAAVEQMRRHMVRRQAEFAAGMEKRLQRTLQDLEQLQARQLADVDQRYAQMDAPLRQKRVVERSQAIRRVFEEYRAWVEETLTTEPQPYIQLLAAVCR